MTGLIVAGMHRSGTSLATRLLSAGGWHPGEVLLHGEREEYFEDAAFVGIHRAWLAACLPPGDGHRDWGVSSGGAPDASLLGDVLPTVTAFQQRREHERDRWVAKDPRATLFLDQWAGVEGLHFVLLYRSPWDVVDSALRLGHPDFCADPTLVRRAWLLHNQRLLAFARHHGDRCTVISSEALAADPIAAWELLAAAVGVNGSPAVELIDPAKLFTRDRHHPIASLTRLLHPECASLLDELDAVASLPRPAGGAPPVRTPLARGGELPAGVGVQVVVPCRDDGQFLDEAIASVEAAACGPTELTIVNDGSTDPETLRILDLLRADGRQVVGRAPSGLSAARNVGVCTSRTLAVLPLDADNRVMPALLAAASLLETAVADVVHGPWLEFGLRNGVVQPPEASLDSLLPTNAIDTCALIRRSLLDEIGGYDEAVTYVEDWDLWLSAIAAGARFHRLPDVTFRYLVRPDSLVSRAWGDVARFEAAVRHVLGKHTAVTGEHTARLVLQLMNLRRELDALYRTEGDRLAEARSIAAEAAQHVASADDDRAFAVQRWEMEAAAHAAAEAAQQVAERAALEVREALAGAQGYAHALAADLAAVIGHRDEVVESLLSVQRERDALVAELADTRKERSLLARELDAARRTQR